MTGDRITGKIEHPDILTGQVPVRSGWPHEVEPDEPDEDDREHPHERGSE